MRLSENLIAQVLSLVETVEVAEVDGPQVGDVVLLCGHRQGRLHWFWFEEPQEFTRPDGSEGSATWFVECEPCGELRALSGGEMTVRDELVYREGDPVPIFQPLDDQPAYVRGW